MADTSVLFKSAPAWLFLAVAITIALYFAYQWALPKPIPGIPYNRESTSSILGDLPALMRYLAQHGEMWPWIPEQTTKLNSPVIQIFARPLSKPWVFLADFKESQDILTRRYKEFDRSNFLADFFHGPSPEFHLRFKSADPRFKQHRNLVGDLMTPTFLNEVCSS